MALTLVSLTLTQPTASTATGAAVISVSTAATGQVTVNIPGLTPGVIPVSYVAGPNAYQYASSAVPPDAYVATFTDGAGATLAVPFVINAYDSTPPALVAAHLPVPAVLRAAPAGTPPQPAALLLVVEVLRGTAWLPAGTLRETCDPVTGTARFELSEYLKSQFTPTPPDETGGPDAALAVRYRARYGRAPGFTGAAGTEAGSFTGLALNAALPVNPGADPLPLALGPPIPYGTVPTGLARFRSTIAADGLSVGNAPVTPEAAAPCPARQFVWLHPSGAWCWGLFTGRHEHGAETGDDVTVRRAKGEDFYAGGGDTRATLKVYSDKVDWPTFERLRSIRTARRVYERLASGEYVPVLLERGGFAEYRETDKVFEVNFTARYPVQVVQTF